jgi:hypothetical protein
MTWTLIIMFTISGTGGMTYIPGFSSRDACVKAAKAIFEANDGTKTKNDIHLRQDCVAMR